MKRILSGIQPTGKLHLGNYLGALRNWVELQYSYESFFPIVDLHAITVPQDPRDLKKCILETAALLVAGGINPDKSTIFIQSEVSAHTELMWILACHTPLGWLNRMTQFKDKVGKQADKGHLGLYTYPVLMAADILVYKATHVPVGEDQKQHLELVRDLAQSFNHCYGQEIFIIPEPQIFGGATRVMSLKDGTKKMSKSDPAEGSRINILDDPETVYHKIKKARTDTAPFPEFPPSPEERPEIANLINIYSALAEVTPREICFDFGGRNFSDFKERLAILCVDFLKPIRERFFDLMERPQYLEDILNEGTHKANTLAQHTLKQVKGVIGLGRG